MFKKLIYAIDVDPSLFCRFCRNVGVLTASARAVIFFCQIQAVRAISYCHKSGVKWDFKDDQM